MARDPVCGMHVDENHAAFKVERGGKTYYFCSEGCMLTFQQPERELKKLRNLGAFSFALGVLTFLVMFTGINFPFLPMEWWALIFSTTARARDWWCLVAWCHFAPRVVGG